eukprot:556575-Rhodomonas_salina.1
MGLGKTLQTIAFLCALKEAGLQGPHLVVTPLAVLQNWHNEIKVNPRPSGALSCALQLGRG